MTNLADIAAAEMTALLLVVHAAADYPLQGDFLSKAKSYKNPLPGIDWWIALAMHCLIHAGGVWLVTGSNLLAACEFVAHFAIDTIKCGGFISFRTDQLLHVACKVAIVAVWSLTHA